MKRLGFVIQLSLPFLFLLISNSNAVTFTSVRITSNHWRDHTILNISDNGQVVWVAEDDGEIYLYDGSNITQLTDSDPMVHNLFPHTNDNGQVAWIKSYTYFDSQDYEIYLLDGATTNRLTNNNYTDLAPAINNNGDVVWPGSDGSDMEIYLYDGATTAQLTNNSFSDLAPAINNNGDVVWSGSDGSDREIYLYNGSTTTQLTDNSYNDDSPMINDHGHVVWVGSNGSGKEIYLYDGAATTQLTHNSYDDYSADINNNGHVVWMGHPEGTGFTEIFLYDGATTTQLTDNSQYDLFPRLSDNGHMVWEELDGSDSWLTYVTYDTAPSFRNCALPSSVSHSESIYFSGSANDDNGLAQITMIVSGPPGTHSAFSNSISGTSHSLSSYYFNGGDTTYANIPGTYTVTLIVTDSAGQSTSMDFQVQVYEPLEPNISVTPMDHYFGEHPVNQGTLYEPITISNTGSADLEISDVTISNRHNFTYDTRSYSVPFSPTIAPGSSVTFDARFHPSEVGPLSATLTINSNDPDTPSVELQLTGTGVRDNSPQFNNASLPGEVNVPTSVNFSGTVQDDVALDNITMSVSGPAGTHTILTQSLSGISYSLGDYYFNSGDTTYANTPGSYTVTLTVTDSAGKSTSMDFQIEVNAQIEPNIFVNPSSINFGDIPAGNSSSPTVVTITNTGNTDLIISNMILSDTNNFSLNADDCGTTNPSIVAGHNCLVELLFNPTASSGTLSATLTITSNDTDTQSMVVQLNGTCNTSDTQDPVDTSGETSPTDSGGGGGGGCFISSAF
jgi:hypothetical protein